MSLRLLARVTLYVVLMSCSSVTTSAWAEIKQRESIQFSGLGLLDVQAEATNGRFPKLTILNSAKKVLLQIEMGHTDNSDSFKYNAGIEFMHRQLAGLPNPMLVVIAVGQHGTSAAWEMAVIGLVSGKIEVLWKQPRALWSEGGVYLGDLGDKRGPGIALWDMVWGKDESHVSPHRYALQFYPWDRTKLRFVEGTQYTSKSKYSDDEEALRSLGFAFKDLRQEFKQLTRFW